jgi:hypothetical protein
MHSRGINNHNFFTIKMLRCNTECYFLNKDKTTNHLAGTTAKKTGKEEWTHTASMGGRNTLQETVCLMKK